MQHLEQRGAARRVCEFNTSCWVGNILGAVINSVAFARALARKQRMLNHQREDKSVAEAWTGFHKCTRTWERANPLIWQHVCKFLDSQKHRSVDVEHSESELWEEMMESPQPTQIWSLLMLNVDFLASAWHSANITSECLEIVLKEAEINKQHTRNWVHVLDVRTRASC